MFEKNQIDKDELADAAGILSQAYINLDSLDVALPYMKFAAENTKNSEVSQKYNYLFPNAFCIAGKATPRLILAPMSPSTDSSAPMQSRMFSARLE